MHIAGYLCVIECSISRRRSRLDYAPKLKEIKVTDIKNGLGVFTPLPDKPVSFAALKETLKKAGYTLAAADITVSGTLAREDKASFLVVTTSGQRFTLEGGKLEQTLAGLDSGSRVEITGDWKSIVEEKSSREVITPATARKVQALVTSAGGYFEHRGRGNEITFMTAQYDSSIDRTFRDALEAPAPMSKPAAPASKPPAPIRVTSPGLTVYKGGAVTPRLYFIKQHLAISRLTASS